MLRLRQNGQSTADGRHSFFHAGQAKAAPLACRHFEAGATIADRQHDLIDFAAKRHVDLPYTAVFDSVLQRLLQHAVQAHSDLPRQAFRDTFGVEGDLDSTLTRNLLAQGGRRRTRTGQRRGRGGCPGQAEAQVYSRCAGPFEAQVGAEEVTNEPRVRRS